MAPGGVEDRGTIGPEADANLQTGKGPVLQQYERNADNAAGTRSPPDDFREGICALAEKRHPAFQRREPHQDGVQERQ